MFMLQLNEKGSLTRNPCDWWSSFLFPTPNVWKPRFSSSSKYLTAQLSPIEEAILPSGVGRTEMNALFVNIYSFGMHELNA